eukprot:Platyproteum_vivax@DN5870_c0_g1_i2.p1
MIPSVIGTIETAQAEDLVKLRTLHTVPRRQMEARKNELIKVLAVIESEFPSVASRKIRKMLFEEDCFLKFYTEGVVVLDRPSDILKQAVGVEAKFVDLLYAYFSPNI